MILLRVGAVRERIGGSGILEVEKEERKERRVRERERERRGKEKKRKGLIEVFEKGVRLMGMGKGWWKRLEG